MKERSWRLLTGLLLTIVLSLGLVSVSPLGADVLNMHVLDVGQGQSVLLENDGHYMMIDGGGRSSSSFVVSYLKQLGIEALDCVAVSHYEEDHMSGLIGVVSVFPCGRLLVPSYAGEGALYESLAVSALSNGCEILHPQPGFECTLGDAVVRVIGPRRTDYASENDLSLSFKVSFGYTAFLICGDAQQESEADMVSSGEDLCADVYIANHHGSSTSSTDTFLDAVSPRYAVISCGRDNSYGHPAMETLQRLQNREITMFRTDRQGTITVSTDGWDLWFDQEPSDDWTSGNSAGSSNLTVSSGTAGSAEEGASLETADPLIVTGGDPAGEMLEAQQFPDHAGADSLASGTESEYQYVCNTHTKKFHLPGCNSVSQMKEANTLFTNLSRDELLAEGYEPCGNCHP